MVTDGVADPSGESAASAGTGRLLGTNHLAAAADTLVKGATTLSAAVSTLNQVVGSLKTSYNAGSKWSVGSPWMAPANGNGGTGAPPPPQTSFPSSNGGNPTLGGQPINPSSPTTSGFALPKVVQHVVGGTGKIISIGRNLNGAMGTPSAQKNTNLATANTVSFGMMNFGQMTNGGEVRLYGNQTVGSASQSTADQFAGYATLSNQMGLLAGTSGFRQMANNAAGLSLLNPGLGFSGASSYTASLYSSAQTNLLRRAGINTYNLKTGAMNSPLNIANQILKEVLPDQNAILTPTQIDQLVYAPYSPLVQTMNQWMASGVINPKQFSVIQNNIKSILQARAHGANPTQLQHLLTQYHQGNSKAASQLRSMGFAKTALQNSQDVQASSREKSTGQIDSFNGALQKTTNTLVGMNNALGKLMQVTGWDKFAGALGAGNYLNGKIGMLSSGLGMLGLGSAINGSEAGALGSFGFSGSAGIGSVVSGVAGGVTHLLGSIFGGGGNNESRMSMGGAGAGGVGGNNSGGGGVTRQHLIWPCHGPITNPFGAITPYDHGPHTGVDIGVPTGTPIHAAIAGTVISAGSTAGYSWAGNVVRISSGHGFVTLYGHNSRVAVSVGQQVHQGQTIAYAGQTGNATGPHCHFEIDINGKPVNPMNYLRGGASVAVTPGSGSTGPGGNGPTSPNSAGASFSNGTFVSGIGNSELSILQNAASAGTGSAGAWTPPGSTSTGSGSGSGSGSFPNVGKGSGSVSSNVRIGQQLASAMGWGSGSEWQDLYKLWMHESGWHATGPAATNSSSGAYGIPQSLPASKMASAGPDWRTNPATQIKWGLNYIKRTYGDPVHAWGHEMRFNWYDKGAWSIPKDEVAQIHKEEMIIPATQARQIREVLLHNQPFGMTTKGMAGQQGVILNFQPNSIRLVVGAGATTAMARSLGRTLVDTIVQDERIKTLQNGASN